MRSAISLRKAQRAPEVARMKVVLHIGAHRTGTTSFQAYVRKRAPALMSEGVGFWGPPRTRKGLFTGIQPTPGLGMSAARRARGRISLQLKTAALTGIDTMLVSDENMMGASWLNLHTRTLYPDVGERLSRYVCAFDGQIDKVVMSVRSLDHFWASSAAYVIARGHSVPSAEQCGSIAQARRTWRDVIADVSCAAPHARIEILPFEASAGRPDLMLASCLDRIVPRADDVEWLNRRPGTQDLRAILAERGEDPDLIPAGSERWTPFDRESHAALREAYADDMHWLVAGADGLASLTEDQDHTRAGQTPPRGPMTRGQGHDSEERRLAQPG
jgi:hypothetical protein